MKKTLIIIFLAIASGYIGYHSTLYFLPNVIYSKFKSKSSTSLGVKPNTLRIMLAPDENSRAVVKPNPDFAYVSTFYDVNKRPIRIKGQLPDSTYWSVAFYQPNTVNYYVKNDIQYGSSNLDLILGKSDPNIQNTEFVEATTSKGFMLIRVLVTDKSTQNLSDIEDLLKTITIESV